MVLDVDLPCHISFLYIACCALCVGAQLQGTSPIALS